MIPGLEALKEFKGNNNTILIGRVMGKQHYLDCLQAIEKSLKALEIIKEKRVACDLLTNPDVMDYKKYNARMLDLNPTITTSIYFLTEEEFNLLKEVLE